MVEPVRLRSLLDRIGTELTELRCLADMSDAALEADP